MHKSKKKHTEFLFSKMIDLDYSLSRCLSLTEKHEKAVCNHLLGVRVVTP